MKYLSTILMAFNNTLNNLYEKTFNFERKLFLKNKLCGFVVVWMGITAPSTF